MKIALSSTGKEESTLVDPRFGRCRYFAFYDTEDCSFSFIDNVAVTQGGGAGIVAAQQLIDRDVEVLLTGSLGPNAYQVIHKSGIKAYKVSDVPLNDAVKLLEEGELEPIGEAGPSHSPAHKN